MKIEPHPSIVRAIALNLSRSLHIKHINQGVVQQALNQSPTGSVIFALWHQSLFSCIAAQKHRKVAALTSLSRDGTIIATYMESIGLHPVRGSSSRGGLKAAREIIRLIKDGYCGAITVDGPRGPFKSCKPGPFEIARRSGAPIIPMACRASREYTFRKSWDSFRMPIPFSRIAVAYGNPIWMNPEYPSPELQEQRCRDFENELHCLEQHATHYVSADR
ncbi:MAG: lysophospholipid acyltransferase family protein, partial [Planctomycetes bacterium]|nr:lysophospholipid acyltransferase family protein [Planctomycetota bacterium]